MSILETYLLVPPTAIAHCPWVAPTIGFGIAAVAGGLFILLVVLFEVAVFVEVVNVVVVAVAEVVTVEVTVGRVNGESVFAGAVEYVLPIGAEKLTGTVGRDRL